MTPFAIDNIVLEVLREEPRHGYAIIKRAGELSGGTIRLGTGTLFPAIERLLAAGQIRVTARVDVDAPARRYYEIAD
jgi:PadR family transcriptional regulator PadR